MFLWNVVKVLCEHLEMSEREKDSYSCPIKGRACDNFNSHSMTLSNFTKIYNCMQHEAMGRREMEVGWTNEDEGTSKMCFGYVQPFSEKTTTTLKRTALMAYPVYIVLLKF